MEEISRGSWIFQTGMCFIEAMSKLEDIPSSWMRVHDPASILVKTSVLRHLGACTQCYFRYKLHGLKCVKTV